MPNRLYQSVVHQMKDAIDRPFGVIDENGIIAAVFVQALEYEDLKEIVESLLAD